MSTKLTLLIGVAIALSLYLFLATRNAIAEPSGDQPQPIVIAEKLRTEVTAYSSSPDETDDTPFISADGNTVYDGLIACPRRYPFKTRVRIDDVIYHCGDRMAMKYDHRFDIWKHNKNEAIEYGIQLREVEILTQL